jgi:hypothetical protein
MISSITSLKQAACVGIFIFIVTSKTIISQTDSSQIQAEEIFLNLLQESTSESDNEEVFGILEDLAQNPIDINSASLSELQKIPGLSLQMASIIIEHRKRFGDFFSLSELNLIEGFPKAKIENIYPFLTVTLKDEASETYAEKKTSSIWDNLKNNFNVNIRSRVINDLQERRGFSESKFVGTIPKINNRFLLKYGNLIDAGVLTEKDAGEKSINEFSSYHFALKNYGLIKMIALGDYTLEFGQGLALWSPFSLSKGSDAIYPLKRNGKPINPYKSTNETSFFRGAAMSAAYSNFTISGFYSSNLIDANIDSTSSLILSLPIDGFHRTENEISKKKAGRETLFGARIDFEDENKNLNIGALYYQSKFSSAFFQNSPLDLSGDKFNFFSFYWDLYFDKINIFGESAYDSRSLATLAGASFSFDRDFTFITLIRNYPRNYRNIHAFAFGEQSGNTRNEVGIYSGIQWKSIIGEINFYYDQFKFPYATFDNPLPSTGNEFLFDLKSEPLLKISTNLRYKYEKKEITIKPDNLETLANRLKQTLRGEIQIEASKYLRLKSRIEVNNYFIKQNNVDEFGTMVFQDVRYFVMNNLNFSMRIILFQTDSFNSAIYEYENDLLGILSNTALYGKGIRWYMLIRYKPLDYISLSAKYSETYKPLEKTLGSGYSEINNNVDNKISFQAEINF